MLFIIQIEKGERYLIFLLNENILLIMKDQTTPYLALYRLNVNMLLLMVY